MGFHFKLWKATEAGGRLCRAVELNLEPVLELPSSTQPLAPQPRSPLASIPVNHCGYTTKPAQNLKKTRTLLAPRQVSSGSPAAARLSSKLCGLLAHDSVRSAIGDRPPLRPRAAILRRAECIAPTPVFQPLEAVRSYAEGSAGFVE